jgi:hypothetical protein
MGTFRSREARAESSQELITKPELTVEEIAELFRFSPELVRHAVRAGELRARVVGHEICGVAQRRVNNAAAPVTRTGGGP